jgi:hypothetical protein
MTAASESSDLSPMTDEAAMLAFACGVASRTLDILRHVRPRIRVGIEDGGSLRWVKTAGNGPLKQYFRVRWIVRVRNVLRETRPTPTLGSCGFAVAVDAQTISIYWGSPPRPLEDGVQGLLPGLARSGAGGLCGSVLRTSSAHLGVVRPGPNSGSSRIGRRPPG